MLCEPLVMAAPFVERKRVAHVPNVSALLPKPCAPAGEPSPTAPASSDPAATSASVTTAQTAKGGIRVAHTPTTTSIARPKVPAEFGGKVPSAIRQRYLDNFCTELLKLNPANEALAYKRALEEEQAVYARSASRRVYVNVAVTTVKRLRDAAAARRGTWLVMARRGPLHDLTNAYTAVAAAAAAAAIGPYVSAPAAAVAAQMMPQPLVFSAYHHQHHQQNPHQRHHQNENVYFFPAVPQQQRPSLQQQQQSAYQTYAPAGAPLANRTVSHLDVLAGRGGATGSWSIERNKKTEDIKLEDLYTRLQPYVLTSEQLDSNGFPRPDMRGRRGYASLVCVDARQRVTSQGAPYRQCARCSRMYAVSPDDCTPIVADQCAYHWGRTFSRRGRTLHVCCLQEAPAEPCCVADCHVTDAIDPDNLDRYVTTLDKQEPEGGDPGVFALDCEMCYTVHGNELTRITVINPGGVTVYETLVKPSTPIVDYNTRFSGIKESDMDDVTTTLRDVQAVLLNMFSSSTILIGHSLESDLKALRLIHSTVVDTSVVFPHKLGPPHKRALRTLCSDNLKRIIQNDVGGHDSAEDAISCMDLMLWRLKEDAKARH